MNSISSFSPGSAPLACLLPNKKKFQYPIPKPTFYFANPAIPPYGYPTPTTSPQLPMIARREASFALAGFYLAHLLQPLSSSLAEDSTSQCPLTVAPSGLAFCDKLVGYGPEATKGQLIKAHYVGRLENGKVFDTSYGRGKPLTFRIGVGEVIKGWDQGILGGEGVPPMLAGGKRTLKLPPELGYGVRGAGCKGGSCIIPPDSTLLFDVEFVGKA